MGTNTTLWLSAFTSAALAASACVAEPKSLADVSNDELSAPGAILHVAQFRVEPETPQTLSVRATGIARVLAGAKVPTVTPEEVSRAFAVTPGRADFFMESTGLSSAKTASGERHPG